MLPSQGLFRSIPCPFYLAGLCERPQCAYRHCVSDIRIDRKLASETLDEDLDQAPEDVFPSNYVGGGEKVKDAANSISNCGEPVTVENKIGKNPITTNCSEESSKRLKTAESDKKGVRKRLSQSEEEDNWKRRKVEEGGTMGKILSVTVEGVQGVINSCLPKNTTQELPDIDDLVREIESVGKKSPKHGRHKHKKKKHKESKSEPEKKPESPSKHGNSNRKANGSSSNTKEDGDKHRDRKDKDRHHHKRDSSSSSSSSRKDSHSHRHHRKSSSSSETKSPSKEKLHNDSTTAAQKDRRPSESSSGKGSSTLSLNIPSPPPINTSNRFDALVQSSSDEATTTLRDQGVDASMEFDFDLNGDSDDDPDIVEQECLQMFQDYKPEESGKRPLELVKDIDKKELDDGFSLVGKKRVAHTNAIGQPFNTPTTPVLKKPVVTSKNLQDQLNKRFTAQAHLRPTQNRSPPKTSPFVPPKPVGKSRIAHVPNAGKLAQKPIIASSGSTPPSTASSSSSPGQIGSLTYSQTVAKGAIRQAHQPSSNVVNKKGPLVFRDAVNKSGKIPQTSRQGTMDRIFQEYFRIYENYDVAFAAAVEKEDELFCKCSSKSVYQNSSSNAIATLRKTHPSSEKEKGANNVVSHQEILNGNLEQKNISFKQKKDSSFPEGNNLYKALVRYILNEDQLVENGYPRSHPSGEKGRVTAKPRPGDNVQMTLTNRFCERCKKYYKTTEDGEHLISEVCNYHWGRKFAQSSRMGRGMREANYTCCNTDDSKIGCVTATCHVSKSPVPISSQKGFVTAVALPDNEDIMGWRSWDIVGVDCEMVYTTHGNELARVTVVSIKKEVLYDCVVKPSHRVLDCNTRFSGLTFEDLDRATASITDVQAVLLTTLRPNCILIGHSLESDLIALKLRHDYVIDTAILYPHKLGPPKKRALKTLSGEILGKVIQENETGHDSAEDALVAVELVLAKLKSDRGGK